MRVTHVAPTVFGSDGIFGGGERYPLELARALAREVRCRLVTFGAAHRSREQDGLEVVVLRARRFARGHPAQPVGAGLVRALRDADVVHAHQLHSRTTTLALAAASIRPQRRVVTDHGLLPTRGRSATGLVDRFLAVSQYSADLLDLPADRTRVIFGGADPARFRPDPSESRSGVLFLGRLTPHKGVDRLIQALPAGAALTVAGAGGHDPALPERGYVDRLHELAAASPARVTFTGPVAETDLPALMRRAAVLALPSVDVTCYGRHVAISELLGLSVLEAMASGTPVVASKIGGVPEVVSDGHTGFLVPPGDVAALSDRLTTLLADRSLRERMGREARALVSERFTWESCARRCLDTYHDVVA
ncbi:MAG: glycosyltransferase family 4 protein [Actinobacteria bacterium]|nr:glycosyltransferase family 4 protein [Actinomycetota bacterium]